MLPVYPAKGLICPCTMRVGSWQARHICALELSRTRKFCAILSIACTCGLWQLVHSIFPLMSFTAPAGSAVLPCATRDDWRFEASFSGSTRLNGCEPVKVVPKESTLFNEPTMGIAP